MSQRGRREAGVDLHDRRRVLDLQRSIGERLFGLHPSRVDDFGHRHPLPGRRDGPGLDAGHVQDVLEQSAQPLDF